MCGPQCYSERRKVVTSRASDTAQFLLCSRARASIVWKLKRKNTPTDQERIKELEDRLDAAVAESKRMRLQMDELQQRHELRVGKPRVRKQSKLTGTDVSYSDETVN